MTTTDKPSVLIILATGKMGSGIADAFVASQKYKVYGTSRNPWHPMLLEKGITPIEFEFGSRESIQNALQVSQASVVVLITDLIHIAKRCEIEIEHARVIMDACSATQATMPIHLILCSSNLCECGPEEARHLVSKLGMEQYLKNESGLETYTILRPCSFFENFDDATNMNPLKRGKLSDLYPPNCKMALVATRDIGKAAVLVAQNPKQWNGKTIDCVSCLNTGVECAAILSQVSGVPCTYKQAPPPFLLRLILPDLYYMVTYTAEGMPGYNVDDKIQRFRSLVPDAMGPKEWFTSLGKWSDGSKFNEPPPPSNNLAAYVMLSMPLVILAIVVGFELQK